MGIMLLELTRVNGEKRRIYLNIYEPIKKAFIDPYSTTVYFKVNGWNEVPHDVSSYELADYDVVLGLGKFSKETDENHVTLDGVPRRHIRKLIVRWKETGFPIFTYINDTMYTDEPMVYRNEFGRMIISGVEDSERKNPESPKVEAMEKDTNNNDAEFVKIMSKVNDEYREIYINIKTVKILSNVKSPIKSIQIAGYKEIPAFASDRGDYRVNINVKKGEDGNYRIKSVSATLVDDVDESKFIPVTYKNIPGGVVSKRGFILKESFDDYVEKCKQGTCSDNDKFFKVYFTPSIYTLPQVLNIKDFDVDDEYLYSELYKSFEKYEDGEDEQESECGNCNNCKCCSCDCCDDEEESEHDDNDVVKGPSFVEYLADKMSRGTPHLRNVNDLSDAMFDYLFKFKNGDF